MCRRYHVRERDVDELIELVELGEKRDARARELSGGQRRRLDLALAGGPAVVRDRSGIADASRDEHYGARCCSARKRKRRHCHLGTSTMLCPNTGQSTAN
jgi:hypothetical protein